MSALFCTFQALAEKQGHKNTCILHSLLISFLVRAFLTKGWIPVEKKAFVIILTTNILQASSEAFYVFQLVSQFKVLIYFWINMNLVHKIIYIWITKQRSKYLWTCILSFGKECRGQYENHWKSTFHQYHGFLHVYWIDLVVPYLAAYCCIENFAMHHVFMFSEGERYKLICSMMTPTRHTHIDFITHIQAACMGCTIPLSFLMQIKWNQYRSL